MEAEGSSEKLVWVMSRLRIRFRSHHYSNLGSCLRRSSYISISRQGHVPKCYPDIFISCASAEL
jgi:hypothetical protein